MAGLVSSEEIAPGESGNVRITLDPAGKYGQVLKKVTIHSNDPAQPELDVPVRATVEHGVEADSAVPLEEVLFGREECARCHADPAGSHVGLPLWEAVCSMCHGEVYEYARTLPPGARGGAELERWIAAGEADTGMPGFSEEVGGPLSDEQIESLVDLLATVDPAASR